jgi:hypothetical protein
MSFLSEEQERWQKVKDQMLKQKPVGHISDLVTHNGMV